MFTADELEHHISGVFDRKFRESPPPRVGLDPKSIIAVAGLVLSMMSIAGGVALSVFQTKAEAQLQHEEIKLDAMVVQERQKAIQETQKENKEQLRQVNENVIRIGEKLRVQMPRRK